MPPAAAVKAIIRTAKPSQSFFPLGMNAVTGYCPDLFAPEGRDMAHGTRVVKAGWLLEAVKHSLGGDAMTVGPVIVIRPQRQSERITPDATVDGQSRSGGIKAWSA